jgi:hypothetical protein
MTAALARPERATAAMNHLYGRHLVTHGVSALRMGTWWPVLMDVRASVCAESLAAKA